MSSSSSLYLSSCMDEVPDDAATSQLTLLHVCDLYTLVPRSLFDADNIHRYLIFNDLSAPECSAFFEGVEGVEAEVVFAVPESLQQTARERFESPVWTSHVAALCASLVRLSGQNESPVMGIYVRKHKLDLFLAQSGRLLFCNSFDISGPSDILFFALKVVQSHQLTSVTPVYYMAESPELSLQARQILNSRFRHISVWKAVDDLPLFNLLSVCE